MIRIPKVRVIDGDKQLGIMETRKALSLARSRGLDLVEVAPNSRPPVVKILDYGKLKYDEKKRAKEARAKSIKIVTKEMKFRCAIAEHDINFKINKIRKFISDGNRCKCVVQFRGRERAHLDIGEELLTFIAESLSDVTEIYASPAMEGGSMTMTLTPKPLDRMSK